jgi:hypothetical protein
MDVSKSDCGLRRRDSNGRDVTGMRRGDGLLDRAAKTAAVLDDVIGGEGPDNDVGLSLQKNRRRNTDGRGLVLGLALENHVQVT